MSEEVIKYVQNQIVQAPIRLRSYIQDEAGKQHPQRSLFLKIDTYVRDFIQMGREQNRWIIIPGLRGVGKTTIVAQVFLNHYKRAEAQNFLYISLDEVVNVLGSNLVEVIQAYEKILGVSFEKITQPIFIFVDEAQYDKKWASVLKSLFDRSKKVFIVCSGSSAVALQTNPDVIRRAIFEKLYPANFSEFLMIRDGILPVKDLKQQMMSALFNADSAEDAFGKIKLLESQVLARWAKIDRNLVDEYLKIGTLPFAIRIRDENRVYQNLNLLLDKVINEDVRSLGKFDTKTIDVIKRILFLLAESESLSMNKLAAMLGVSVVTISNVLDVLCDAELLIRVLPHGSNSAKVRKPSRYLFMSAAVRSSFYSIAGQQQVLSAQKGRLLEDVVAMTMQREYSATGMGDITYDSAEAGADFILSTKANKVIPMEVGYGDKTMTQVKSTMKKIPYSTYGLIISNNALTLHKEENIIHIPIEFFLLV